jgi:hypothetical protein
MGGSSYTQRGAGALILEFRDGRSIAKETEGVRSVHNKIVVAP